MAALIKPAPRVHAPELLDLRQLTARDLDAMLTQETRTWKETLDWDFQKSADLVRHFLDQRSLYGYALLSAGRVIGYSYYVFEEHKGLIGDLYVLPDYESPEHDCRLLTAVLDGLIATPHIRRIECQLMTVHEDAARSLPAARYLQAFDRDFMLADLDVLSALPPTRLSRRIAIEKWAEHHQEATAHLIAESYRGHLDARINDQYRSVAGARRFLYNIVQYPGCGNFFKPASLVALDLDSGELCGLSLTSLVADDVGHVTQLCVSPKARGTGLGYELLRQSLQLLREAGCGRASLTVTSANLEAMRLYRNAGFRSLRRFGAYVWEGF
ncbi:MAG: GNAT family N-acetyltransferase [Acidobacteriota bacterium]|nr:GNAT family N-acetyltransferase [Acidobacteriota bacterium]